MPSTDPPASEPEHVVRRPPPRPRWVPVLAPDWDDDTLSELEQYLRRRLLD